MYVVTFFMAHLLDVLEDTHHVLVVHRTELHLLFSPHTNYVYILPDAHMVKHTLALFILQATLTAGKAVHQSESCRVICPLNSSGLSNA